MNKHIIAGIIAFLMAMTLVGCGGSASTTPAPPLPAESSIDEPATSASESIEESEPVPTDEPGPEIPAASINWQDIVCQYTARDGYTFEITIKMSPWILQSNTELINSAWDTVGNGNILPDINGWGLRKFTGNGYLREFSDGLSADGKRFSATMTDMYYIVGTISVKNVTDGWSFSSDNPGSLRASLDWSTFWSSDPTTAVISRIFYSSKEETYGGTMRVFPSMTSNKWGPVPFVIGHGELFNPNFPNGAYRNQVESNEFILMGGHNTELQRFTVPIQDTDAVTQSDTQSLSQEDILGLWVGNDGSEIEFNSDGTVKWTYGADVYTFGYSVDEYILSVEAYTFSFDNGMSGFFDEEGLAFTDSLGLVDASGQTTLSYFRP